VKKICIALGLATLVATASAHGAARKPYIIELTDAPVAAYKGNIAGLKATRPAKGTRLNIDASSVQAYTAFLETQQSQVAALVPNARITYRYKNVINGFAAWLTDAEFAKLAASAGVRAITVDSARKLDTSYTPEFLGINGPGGAWSQVDGAGRSIKGEGVILGHIDGGVWPENPSVSDKVDAVTGKPIASHLPGTVVYDPLPEGRYKGTCQAGEGFEPTMCNNKLIGAQYFNTTFKLAQQLGIVQVNSLEFLDSPRDQDGHGSHTLTTAGGNENVDVVVSGTPISNISGMAPRARLAAYKACWNTVADTGGSCFQSDTVAAIEQAVADGVDVINFSIAGSQTSVRDIVETAFINAALSNVFVAASAGNNGPGNAVAHNSPWIITVGNSTHDRYTEATVTLGSGTAFQGSSFQTQGLSAKPLIWSRDAGFGAAAGPGTQQAQCLGVADGLPSTLLDPAKVAGKIVVCDRGGNVLVNKVENAQAAGAVGVIILNRPQEGDVPASSNTTPLITGVLPTVHLAVAAFQAVTAEARKTGGTASFSPSFLVPGVPAPVMANTSSRGPNRADADVLKPDITAPGTDIIAAYSDRSMTASEREQIIAGTLVPEPAANMISGTSMSSPHVAGAAALLIQANPTWSPFAIKSALMTSARQSVVRADGTVDPDRWGFGSGHLDPNAALATKVVYDSDYNEYVNYYFGLISGRSLNLPSLTYASVVGAGALTRKLTNRGTSTVTYNVSATLPGFNIVVTPATLTLAPGQTKSYRATLTRNGAPIGVYAFGELVWTDATSGQSVRSPLTAKAESLVALSSVTDTRNVGTKVFTVGTGYNGGFAAAATGLVPATRKPGTVATGEEACFAFKVPAGAKMLRAQLFNSETEGGAASDLDLAVYRGTTTLGRSETASSDELVTINAPVTGDYEACVEGYAPVNGKARFTLNLWVVGPTVTPSTLRAAGPSKVYTGGTASVAIAWNVAAGARYLGVVEYADPAVAGVIGRTTVFIDNVATSATSTRVRISRDKNAR
jgi:hypothetical protein